jgi:hypothetical protein
MPIDTTCEQRSAAAREKETRHMQDGTTSVPEESMGNGAAQADVFGTRLRSGKPHSTNLQAAAMQASAPSAVARSVDVLVGVGVGAAAMYYLDPDGGARRRALVRDGITSPRDSLGNDWTAAGRLVAGLIGGALALLATRRRDALGAAVGLVGSALLACGFRTTRRRPAPPPSSDVA